jgi:hypothetical protein
MLASMWHHLGQQFVLNNLGFAADGSNLLIGLVGFLAIAIGLSALICALTNYRGVMSTSWDERQQKDSMFGVGAFANTLTQYRVWVGLFGLMALAIGIGASISSL